MAISILPGGLVFLNRLLKLICCHGGFESGVVSLQRRHHHALQTVYQRLMAAEELSLKTRKQLREHCKSLDPFALAQAGEKQLKQILN